MSIRVLDASIVQRIAAGEVIDRPCSIIRELLDNSIDAGAKKISVWIQGGGIDSIIVSDDGKGMDEKDLALACQRHATSKISKLDDIFHLGTMGFRGEALYSIAACARLTIASNKKSKTVDNTVQEPVIDAFQVEKGTMITVEGLFSQLPARKMFLKRPVTEAMMCRNMMVEKALAFPEIEFKLFSDGDLKIHLQSESSKQRFIDVLSADDSFIASDVAEFNAENNDFKLYGIGTTSDSYRSDRSQIRIFVNNHCVDDFQMVMAITNGYNERFPGGRFPYFYLFITINPELVDFNIHPAKRECRIRIKAQVSGWVTTMIRNQLKTQITTVKTEPPKVEKQYELHDTQPAYGEASVFARKFQKEDIKKFDESWFENAKNVMSKPRNQFQEIQKRLYRYIGQAFKLFLVVEKDNKLLFVDQHAAHERILYDDFKKDHQVQRLLLPFRFEVEHDTDAFLLQNSYIYDEFGIELTRPEDLVWEINTIPMISKGVEDRIAAFIKDNTGDLEEIEKSLFSTMACRAAIKAGDDIDQLSALSLLDKVFELEKPCCPHGRTFITEITEESLREAVGRFR